MSTTYTVSSVFFANSIAREPSAPPRSTHTPRVMPRNRTGYRAGARGVTSRLFCSVGDGVRATFLRRQTSRLGPGPLLEELVRNSRP